MRAKKATAVLTIMTLAGAMALPVYAEETNTADTTLKATVKSDYTLTIPAAQTISEDSLSTSIGEVKVTGTIHPTQEVKVTVTKAPNFVSTTKASDVIPFALNVKDTTTAFTEATWDEKAIDDKVTYPLSVDITQDAWDNADAGDYQTILVFTAALQDKSE